MTATASTRASTRLGMCDVTFGLRRAARRGRGRGGRTRSTGCPSRDAIDHVVVLGMGGSGIAGDVLAAVAGPVEPRARRPSSRTTCCPASSARARSCVALSFSGDTEETLGRRDGGARARARPWSSVSAGRRAGRAGRGRAVASRSASTPTIPMPRAALGALVAPVAGGGGGRRACSPAPARQVAAAVDAAAPPRRD